MKPTVTSCSGRVRIHRNTITMFFFSRHTAKLFNYDPLLTLFRGTVLFCTLSCAMRVCFYAAVNKRQGKKSTVITPNVSVTLQLFFIVDKINSKLHKVIYNKYDNSRH